MGACACGDSHERRILKLNQDHERLLQEKEVLELQRRNEIVATANALLQQNVNKKGEKRANIDAEEVDEKKVVMTLTKQPATETLKIGYSNVD